MNRNDYNYNNNNNFNNEFSAPTDLFAAAASAEERSRFIARTYTWLACAVLSMVVIEFALFGIFGIAGAMKLGAMMGGAAWIVVLVLFMAVQWLANKWASNTTSMSTQVAGLALYATFASALIFPLLALALVLGGPQIIMSAGFATGGLFALMTLAVFVTRKDFSFLRTALVFAGFALLGLIIFSIFFSGVPTTLICYIGIAFACGYILFDTSNVMLHYRTDQHAAASLALLASLFLLFWYILQLFLASRE